MGRIIVGIDGSRNSAAALRWAVAEGRLRDLPVTAVYVWGYYDPPTATDGAFEPAYSDDEAEDALRRAVADALGDEAARRQRRVVFGQASGAPRHRRRRRRRHVVVGARGVGFRPAARLGGPAVPAPPTGRWWWCRPDDGVASRPGRGRARIVVGVDGSTASRWALGGRWRRVASARPPSGRARLEPAARRRPPAGPVPVDTAALGRATRLVDQMVDSADTGA